MLKPHQREALEGAIQTMARMAVMFRDNDPHAAKLKAWSNIIGNELLEADAEIVNTDAMFALGDGRQYIYYNPGGRFHGWLFTRHPDGQFVSQYKLYEVPLPKPSKEGPA
jgi:hypothetical protein